MEAFGPLWANYTEKIRTHWLELITPDDLVLIPGDISWALRLEDAVRDLEWIDALPGTKVMIKGNHDLWWSSLSKLAKVLPPSIHVIQNNVFNWRDVTIGGARLWDSEEYRFNSLVHFQPNERERPKETSQEDDEKIFKRELERLKLSLSQLDPKATHRIALTHYPPIGNDLLPSRASTILEEHGVQICVFGHLHSVKRGIPLFGTVRGVRYVFTSCDYLDFIPLKIL